MEEREPIELEARRRDLQKVTVYLLPEAWEGVMLEHDTTGESRTDIINRRIIFGHDDIKVKRRINTPESWVLALVCIFIGFMVGVTVMTWP